MNKLNQQRAAIIFARMKDALKSHYDNMIKSTRPNLGATKKQPPKQKVERDVMAGLWSAFTTSRWK